MKAIRIQLEINRVSIKKDDSVSFTCSTPAITDEELGVFRDMSKVMVNALLEPIDGSEDIIEVTTAIDEKSPSQRLRGVLWRLHQQNNEGMEWEMFYRVKMERLIDALKAKLD